MKFSIKFKTKENYKYPIFFDTTYHTGLNVLKEVRKKLNCKVSPGIIVTRIERYAKEPELVLTEEQAEKSGLFAGDDFFYVKTPAKVLNKFVSIEIDYQQADDGKFTKIWFDRETNNDLILKAWAADGYPLEWNPDNNEEEE